MPRVQVHIPADLYEKMKAQRVRPSAMFQAALREELRRQELIKEIEEYAADLADEFGEASPEEVAEAEAFVAQVKALHERTADGCEP